MDINKYNIAICTDENFVKPALVCITTIFENNKDNFCTIHVLTDGLSENSTDKFNKLSLVYNRPIKITVIDNNVLNSMITRGRYRQSMYYRFLLPEILQNDAKVLYLDCDIMNRRSLYDLFSIDLTGKACAVIPDQQCDDIVQVNRLQINSIYFNSGVMLMNLDYWREHSIASKLIKFIEQNPDKCLFPDQDALNKVLDGKVLYLPYRYNYQELWYTQRNIIRFHYSKWHELDKEGLDPVFVHFCVTEKPWHKECINPWLSEYLLYANLHEFINFKVSKRYSMKYKCLAIAVRIFAHMRDRMVK